MRRTPYLIPLWFMLCSCSQLFLPRVLGMYLLAALAFLFYVSKVPERYFPGHDPSVFINTAPLSSCL